MTKVFISYRRADSIDIAGRIYDRLTARFGHRAVFMDVDSMAVGDDFRPQLADALARCDAVLVVIGKGWLQAEPDGRRRLDDAEDFVRAEVAAALARPIPVVPVLTGGARMPAADELPPELAKLAYLQAATVDSGRDFGPHVGRLIADLERRLVGTGPDVAGSGGRPGDRGSGAEPAARRVALPGGGGGRNQSTGASGIDGPRARLAAFADGLDVGAVRRAHAAAARTGRRSPAALALAFVFLAWGAGVLAAGVRADGGGDRATGLVWGAFLLAAGATFGLLYLTRWQGRDRADDIAPRLVHSKSAHGRPAWTRGYRSAAMLYDVVLEDADGARVTAVATEGLYARIVEGDVGVAYVARGVLVDFAFAGAARGDAVRR